ncbi:MAG: ABC transporter permease [Chloroflexi bacterium]|nr:ABC transporter permease [Chloroflexota bacterium]
MASPELGGELRTGLPRAVGAGLAAAGRKGRNALRLTLRTTAGRIGLPIVLLHLTLALIGPLLAPYDPIEFLFRETGELQQLLAPSRQFWLGTDQFGRDVLSRVMSGAMSLIVVSVAGAALGIALGTVVGMSSGYKGGRVDEVVMRVMDGLMSFPSLLLALLVMATLADRPPPVEWLEPYWQKVLIVATIGVVNMPSVARVIRSTTLFLKTQEFVQSARLRGEPASYIIFREILPNTLPILGVEMSVRLSYAILTVSSLGFLGLGIQPPSPDWGLMISQSRPFLVSAPWVALAPMAAVASLVVGINLLADGLRQARGLPQEKMS